MAKHKLSAMFSDLRGKLNGSKFSKGRSCHTLTNKVKGSNPRTSSQGVVRSLFREYTSKWKTLDPGVILAWNSAANDTAYKNIFGDSYKTTGHKLYVKLNVEALLNGFPEIPIPIVPVVPTIVDIANLSMTAATHVHTFDTLQPLDAGTALIITATRPVSPGKTNLKGLYRRIGTIPAPLDAGQVDFHNMYEAEFGIPTVGKKVGVIVFTSDPSGGVKFKAGAELAKAVK